MTRNQEQYVRLPDFLIVGAMKAGTTSLFRDLDANPAVFMPYEKELGNLASDDVCTDRGRRAYAAFFERARPDQICGEASTEYTKLPDVPRVAQRAREVIGGGFKVLYLIREPVSRIVSQHHHELPEAKISCGIDEAVREFPRFINYSRYAMQITPWLEALGPEQILILRFETYIENRRGSVAEVCSFLGIEASSNPLRENIVYNKSESKPLTRGPLTPLVRSAVYRKLFRPHLPHSARDRLRKALLPKALPRPKPPSVETVRYIIDQLRDDGERLRTIMGRPEPLWDPDEVLRSYQEVRGES